MNVDTMYRHMSCKKLAKMPLPEENRQTVLKNAVKHMAQLLYERKSYEEILYTVSDFLTKNYKNEWFTFYWQREQVIKNDLFCFERFLKWLPKDCLIMAHSVYVSVTLKKTLPDGSNLLKMCIPLIFQAEDGTSNAILLHFKKTNKSKNGRSIHTSIATDLYVMVAKAALEMDFPRIRIISIYLRNIDDTDSVMLPELKVCNTKESNVFIQMFDGFYENNVFQTDAFLAEIENVIAQPMETPCYLCRQKNLCCTQEMPVSLNSAEKKKEIRLFPEYTKIQQKVVTFKNGSMLVCAGPGSGKTATLVGRVKALMDSGVSPETILVITFTNEAAKELYKRCEWFCCNSMPKVTTLNAFGYEILKANKDMVGMVNLLDGAEQLGLIKSLLLALPPLSNFNYAVEYGKYGLYKTVCSKLNSYINAASAEDFFQKEPSLGSDFIRFAESYKRILEERNYITFDEQISLCNKLFDEHSEILDIYQNVYRFVMVDEAQDLNKEQTEFIYKIASHGNIMLVGDDDQSIYGFRGASNQYMLQFPRIFPNTETIVLNDNFRSTEPIVNAAQNLIQKNQMRIKKHICCYRKTGDAPILLTGMNAFEITDIVKKCISNGYAYNEIAVISTKNATLEALHSCLDIPTVLAKSYLRKDFLFLLLFDILELYENINAYETLLHYLFLMGVTIETEHSLFCDDIKRNYPDVFTFSLYQIEKDDSIYMALRFLSNMFYLITSQTPLLKMVSIIAYNMHMENTSSMAALEELIETKHLHERTKLHEYMRFMIDFEDERRISVSNIGKVLLITSHESKGMEFPVVIMLNDYKENSEETRRLFYVAMTRAKDCLYILSEKECNTGFLEEL